MALTPDDVAALARLARIELTDDELAQLAPQLDVILESVAHVTDVAADDIPPTSHALPLTNVFRADVTSPSLPLDRGARRCARRGAGPLPGAADPGGGGVSHPRRRRPTSPARISVRARSARSRSPRRTSTGSPRSTARCTPSCTSTASGRWPGPPRSTPRSPPASQLGPLAGVPLALKDVLTYEGAPTTCGSKILEGWLPPYDATVTAAAAGRRHRDPRQDQHGRVRDGLLDRELRVRPDPQPVGPGPDPRRLRRRVLGRPGRLRGAAGDRHRHRRLDPAARLGHRHRRGQADLRRHLPLRPGRAGLQPRPGRALRAYGARRRAAAPGDRRARPARLHLDRRTGPRRRRRGPLRRRGRD